MIKAEDLENYYRIQADARDLNYDQYFSDGNTGKKIDKEYNSSNTKILDKEELIKILLELPEVQSQL